MRTVAPPRSRLRRRLVHACAALTLALPVGAQDARSPAPDVVVPGPAARAQLAERNKAVVERLFREAWADTNFRVADEIYAADYVRHDGSRPAEGAGETPRQSQVARDVRESNRSFDFRIDRLIAEGDYVVVRWSIRTEPRGVMGAVKRLYGARGPVEFVGVNIARLQDGRIVEIWNHRDDLAFVEQVGAVPFLATTGFAGGVLVATLAAWALARRRGRRRAGALVTQPI